MLKDILKRYRANTAGRREMTTIVRRSISKEKPVKSLTEPLKKSTGRDRFGHVTTRHKGGGAKRLYRVITDLAKYPGEEFKVLRKEYDPNRTAYIALVQSEKLGKRYILAPEDLQEGDTVLSGEKVEIKSGNRMQLKNIPSGTAVYDVELVPGRGGQIAKGAGTFATVLDKEGKYVSVRLPSSEIRKIHENSYASIGTLSNILNNAVRVGKAGRKRHMGVRPSVRGKAMHPAAHPHGGGEGLSPIGMKHPKTPWGKPALGKRTRGKRKLSDKFIVARRKSRKR